MGLDCILEDEFGEELEVLDDADGSLAASWPSGDPAYPYLRRVDLEGTTTFNRLQLADVMPELERLAEAAPAVKPRLRAIVALARKAVAEPHLHLRFLGD
ncbi:MAG: hypothetical protein SF051_14670 [Elusimicrobiota bacterium]|nr:hypothetical protein [Elusimicrobiota bacterium]